MKVKNREFFHLSRYNTLEVGSTYEIGKEFNYFFTNPFTSWEDCVFDNIPYFDLIKRLANSDLKLLKRVTKKQLVSISLEILAESQMVIREMIFEKVRKENYPDKVSRESCVFLIPNEMQINSWHSVFTGSNDIKLFRVNCSGDIHKGSNEYLDINFTGLEFYYQNAHKYWNSEKTDFGHDQYEILFQGELEILEELNLLEFI